MKCNTICILQILWHNCKSKTSSGKSCILRKASKLDRTGSCTFTLVDGMWYIVFADICFVCCIINDHSSDLICVVNPFLKLCFADGCSCRIIWETQIDNVRLLLREFRCKSILLQTRHIDHIAPESGLFIISSGSACHYI